MTYKEIILTIENFNKQEKLRLQEKAIYDYRLADLIGLSVLRKAPDAFPKIYDIYSELFNENEMLEKQLAQQPQEDNRWKVLKENFKTYAKRHNKERGEAFDN